MSPLTFTLKEPTFHQKTEEEPKGWLEGQRSSFTDAKEVLKELGIEEDPQSYTQLIHHFPHGQAEIDQEIKDLVIKVLDFFNIPTDTATPPSGDTASASSAQEDTSALSEQGTENPYPDLD
ncbi:uncharacterized protein LOC144865658 isoform X2 [Branchiostoma floridae x Branchiostoma japonicum]